MLKMCFDSCQNKRKSLGLLLLQTSNLNREEDDTEMCE